MPSWKQVYDHSPTSQELETFLDVNKWWDQLGNEFRIMDAEVCSKAWKKVAGQLPIKTFSR
jgi:hypothetical protein